MVDKLVYNIISNKPWNKYICKFDCQLVLPMLSVFFHFVKKFSKCTNIKVIISVNQGILVMWLIFFYIFVFMKLTVNISGYCNYNTIFTKDVLECSGFTGDWVVSSVVIISETHIGRLG